MNEIFNPPLNSFVVPLKEEFLEEQAGTVQAKKTKKTFENNINQFHEFF